MHSEALQDLAIHYEGKIQFSYCNIVLDEKIALAYDIPPQNQGPFSFYIDSDGIAYNYNLVMPSLNVTTDWIDNKRYTKSPLFYKAQPQLSDLKLKWAYAKKEVRLFYIQHLRDFIETYLRQFKLTYLVDMDPTDFTEVKLNQKTDRQILFLFAMFVWVVETLWDMVKAPEKTKKIKSKIKSGKKTEKEE